MLRSLLPRCHGSWTLIEAKVVEGRTLTSWPSSKQIFKMQELTGLRSCCRQGLVTSRLMIFRRSTGDARTVQPCRTGTAGSVRSWVIQEMKYGNSFRTCLDYRCQQRDRRSDSQDASGERAKVVLSARTDQLERLSQEIERAGGQSIIKALDVTDRDSGTAWDELEKMGGVDILINNAGLMPLVLEGRVDEWERMIDVNIKGLLYAIHAVLPGMASAQTQPYREHWLGGWTLRF